MILNFQSVNLQSEQNVMKSTLCEAVGKLHETVHALCPNKSLPVVENVCRFPRKILTPTIPVKIPTRPMSVPTAAALKMGVGFPLNNLPGTFDDTNRILSTQCQNQSTELLNECGICKQVNDQHCLAKCDTCKLYYHLGCLTPPLTRHPKKSKIYGWQCSECDEDNPDGMVQLPSGPRKSRTKYGKDGKIVPVEANQPILNGNDTAGPELNSLSPSSNRSDRKSIKTTENCKLPAYITNPLTHSPNVQTNGPRPKTEKKCVNRRFKSKMVKNMANFEAATISQTEGGDEPNCEDSVVSPTISVKNVNSSSSIVKRSKKFNSKEQTVTNISIANTTQSYSSNIYANAITELTSVKQSIQTIGTAKPNRKRRKEKHRSKERMDRSSSKERKKKRKRKNYDGDNLPASFSMTDGVPKIKIKVK